MELIRTETRDRKAKLQDIAEKIMRKPESYDELEKRLTYWAEKYGRNIHQIHAREEYPEEIEW